MVLDSNIVLKNKKNILFQVTLSIIMLRSWLHWFLCFLSQFLLFKILYMFLQPFFALLRKINDWAYTVFQAIYFNDPILLKIF